MSETSELTVKESEAALAVANGLPALLGRQLLAALGARQQAREDEARRLARRADESWQDLCRAVWHDLGNDLAGHVVLERPDWFGDGTHFFEVRVSLPGLAPLVAGYHRDLLGKSGYGPWRRQLPASWKVEAPEHTSVCPDLASALVEAFDHRPGARPAGGTENEIPF